MAGIVESVGKGVTRFRPGDEVFGETVRGYQWTNQGAYAEYAAAADTLPDAINNEPVIYPRGSDPPPYPPSCSSPFPPPVKSRPGHNPTPSGASPQGVYTTVRRP